MRAHIYTDLQSQSCRAASACGAAPGHLFLQATQGLERSMQEMLYPQACLQERARLHRPWAERGKIHESLRGI
jgi:hypothetical protein